MAREARQLADFGEAASDQAAGADEEHEGHRRPHDQRGPQRSPAQRSGEAPTGGGETLGPVVPAGELAAQVGVEAGAPVHLQPPHLAVRKAPRPLHDLAGTARVAQDAHVPDPRRHDVARLAAPRRHQRVDGLDGAGGQRLRQYAGQMKGPVRLEQSAQPVPGLEEPPVAIVVTAGKRLEVAHPRRGSDEHACARNLRPPAQVEVLAVERYRRVEAAERHEEVGADEREATRHREHVAHGVVLLLVELAPLDQRRGRPGLVNGHSHLEQVERVVPRHQLRADDARVGSEGLLDEQAHRVGLGRDVVVAEQEERRPLHHRQRVVGGRAKAGVLVQAPDERTGQHRRHPGRRVGGARGVDHQHAQVGVVLRPEAAQRLLQPRPGVVGDHDRHDRRGGRRGGRRGVHPGGERSEEIRLQLFIDCGYIANSREHLGGSPCPI